jgi:hypothetical protein
VNVLLHQGIGTKVIVDFVDEDEMGGHRMTSDPTNTGKLVKKP